MTGPARARFDAARRGRDANRDGDGRRGWRSSTRLLATARGGGGPKYVERHRHARQAAGPRAHRAAARPRQPVPRAAAVHRPRHRLPRRRQPRHRHRRRRGRRVRDRPATTRRSAAARTTRTRCARRCARRRSPSATGCRSINLVESGGADLPTQADQFVPGGAMFRNLTRLSSLGIPTIALVFGSSTAGGAYVPGLCDHTVFVRDRAQRLPRRPAAREDGDGRGGRRTRSSAARRCTRARPACRTTSPADEHDALRLGRDIVRRLNWRKHGPGPTEPADAPLYDPEELLGVMSADPKVPFDPRRPAGARSSTARASTSSSRSTAPR